eukprot:g3734.t1
MWSLLSTVLDDFRAELEFAKEQKAYTFITHAIYQTISNLVHLEEVFLDSLHFDQSLKRNLKNVLLTTEEEIGCLLWSQNHEDLIHRRIIALLVRVGHYRNELELSFTDSSGVKFRLPLFSRSDSFRCLDYTIDENLQEQNSWNQQMNKFELTMERQMIRLRAESKRTKNEKKSPPPPPSAKSQVQKKRSEITRIPKVIRLFHTFQSPSQDQRISHGKSPVNVKSRSISGSSGSSGSSVSVANPSAVLDELMSKSKHVRKINEEIEKHTDTIHQWADEIKTISFNSMNEVIEFVEKMDRNINQNLTDETTVLKRIKNWPSRYDVMRDAYGRWMNLKKLQLSQIHWNSDPGLTLDDQLEKMKAFVDRVDARLQDFLRTQSAEELKYTKHGIPWSSEIFDQVKRASLVILEQYMKLVLQNVKNASYTTIRRRDLLSNCACFAFKVHQMVGGLNDACTKAFIEVEAVAQGVIADWKGLSTANTNTNSTSSQSNANRRGRRVFPVSQPPCNVANC